MTTTLAHLRAAGVSLVLDWTGDRLPVVLAWGADLGDLSAADLAALAATSVHPRSTNAPDVPVAVAVLPEAWTGWLGTPGLAGHRDGRDWSPKFTGPSTLTSRDDGSSELRTAARDDAAGLALDLVVELTPQGLVRTRATVTNTGDDDYVLDHLLLGLPVPSAATQVLDFTGRHNRERSPQRHPFLPGSWVRDNRRGRTGGDATLLLLVGTPEFGFGRGEVWGVHTAWSGNHRTLAERATSGESWIGGGELLLPGEVRLAPGEAYTSPWVWGSSGHGIDQLSGRFHDLFRARPEHPAHPRPVIVNTWEAVYFDHDLARLTALADAAAEVGAELFVLDDGWFGDRRDDTRGLGDWTVARDAWPDGLHPLVDHVRALGLQFGLWVEPEMINLDSDLARAHPDWVMTTGGRTPIPARHQHLLDLANPAAFEHILGMLDALVVEYRPSYLKWDHNRDLVDAGRPPGGEAGVHAQTLAYYRLVDALKARHPGLEIESCSSGGARADLEVLHHTDRIWTSDCTDAHERQEIQRWTGLLVPPELLGAHVSSPTNHGTGRTLTLGMRAATALFGSFGIEWDLTSTTPAQRAALAEWVAFYRQWRAVLHSGRVVHGDHPDPAVRVHGVVAADSSCALFAVVATDYVRDAVPGRVCLPGLDPARRWLVRPVGPREEHVPYAFAPAWWADGTTLPGSVLAGVGLQMPVLLPDSAVLLEARAV